MIEVVWYQIRNSRIRDMRILPEGEVPLGVDWVLAEGVKVADAKVKLGTSYDGSSYMPFNLDNCKVVEAPPVAVPIVQQAQEKAKKDKVELEKTAEGRALLSILALLTKDESLLPL